MWHYAAASPWAKGNCAQADRGTLPPSPATCGLKMLCQIPTFPFVRPHCVSVTQTCLNTSWRADSKGSLCGSLKTSCEARVDWAGGREHGEKRWVWQLLRRSKQKEVMMGWLQEEGKEKPVWRTMSKFLAHISEWVVAPLMATRDTRGGPHLVRGLVWRLTRSLLNMLNMWDSRDTFEMK